MWRTWDLIVFTICLSLILIGFSACGKDNQTSENTKYLAKNIVLNNNNSALVNSTQKKSRGMFALNVVPKSYAQSDSIDTETKLLAENVIFENSSNSQIESDNVQNALEEISMKLSDVMIGTWNIQNYNQEEEYHTATGKIIINNDGTFDLTEGSFAAIGMGSGTELDGMCTHKQENQTYQVFAEGLVAFQFYGLNSTEPDSVIPVLVKLRENEIVFISTGAGGCGTMGRQRISRFTRIVE